MPSSMTGYGTATVQDQGVSVTVELRSVNHRHLDVKFRPSIGLPALESKLVASLRKAVQRGHVDIRVTATAQAAQGGIRVDVERAGAYKAAADQVAAQLGVDGALSLRDLLTMPGVLETAASSSLLSERQGQITAAFDQAVEAFLRTRAVEGGKLAQDLTARVSTLSRLRAEIAEYAGAQFDQRRSQLKTRLTDALGEIGASVDAGRLEQELVHIADRGDITEELVRLAAHLETFAATLAVDGEVGRKLGFLGQELLREINTVGSKSQLLEITERVVAAKVEVEKCREQLLNLE